MSRAFREQLKGWLLLRVARVEYLQLHVVENFVKLDLYEIPPNIYRLKFVKLS